MQRDWDYLITVLELRNTTFTGKNALWCQSLQWHRAADKRQWLEVAVVGGKSLF